MADAFDIDTICIGPEMSIGDALRRLDQTHKRILLIVDEDSRLLGVVADPDFRRAILAQVDFKEPIKNIMTRDPVIARQGMSNEEVMTLMEGLHAHGLPVVDARGRVVDLVQIESMLRRRNQQRGAPCVAVVMAGGLGERLRPLTETTPKPLIPVGDKPILFTILDKLLAARFERIYLAVNYKADVIRDAVMAVPRYRDHVSFIQEEKRLGTIGALSLLSEPPDGPFLVTNGDLLSNVPYEEMLRFHVREKNALTVGLREEHIKLAYGIAHLEGTRILGITEKPTITQFINAGVYVINPSVLKSIPRGAYFDATDLIKGQIINGRRVGGFLVREYWIDIGQPHQLEQARRDYDETFGDAGRQD